MTTTQKVGRRLTFVEAIVEAIGDEMRRDADVFFLGQDIGPFGGAMQGAKGLWQEFGDGRVLDAPISEGAMVGGGIGAALFGARPIVEISFGEFLPAAMNYLACHAGTLRYGSGGRARVPLVVRTRVGDGPHRGHPQCFESWFVHLPGLKVVMPATPGDAKGLMIAAIRDDNPVLFFEHMYLYHGVRGEVPVEPYTVPIGKAEVMREGRDVTVMATAWMVHRALEAAAEAARDGISVEVVDLRTLAPLDRETILASVGKTRRAVIAHEAWRVGGCGAEVSATIAEELGGRLAGPIVRVGAAHVPLPANQPLRRLALPDRAAIMGGIRKAVGGGPGGTA